MTPRRTRSEYTGKPVEPGGLGGTPCSDCHHAPMYLPEGRPYDTRWWLCSECDEPIGFHHQAASCGKPADILTAHPLRVPHHRPNGEDQ